MFRIRKDNQLPATSKLDEGLRALSKIKLNALKALLIGLKQDPGDVINAPLIQKLTQIGRDISRDHKAFTIEMHHANPDLVLARIISMIPYEMAQLPDLKDKLDYLSQICDAVYAYKDQVFGSTPEAADVHQIEFYVLPPLEKLLVQKTEALKNYRDKTSKGYQKALNDKRQLEAKYFEMSARAAKPHVVFVDFNMAIAVIFNALKFIQSDPAESHSCVDWLVDVTTYLARLSSVDPALKDGMTFTDYAMKGIHKDVPQDDKAELLFIALWSDFEKASEQFLADNAGKKKPTFIAYMNKHPDNYLTAHRIGLIFKAAMQYFPDQVPTDIKAKLSKMELDKLKNPYKDFLVNVSAPASQVLGGAARP